MDCTMEHRHLSVAGAKDLLRIGTPMLDNDQEKPACHLQRQTKNTSRSAHAHLAEVTTTTALSNKKLNLSRLHRLRENSQTSIRAPALANGVHLEPDVPH